MDEQQFDTIEKAQELFPAEGHAKESTAAREGASVKAKSKKLDVAIPYLSTPGSIKTALERIKSAATPERVTGDFVETKLQFRGGQGRAILSFLKKIGLAGPDGIPTPLYRSFRNSATAGSAIASAIRHGYRDLADVNEYFYELDDQRLKGLIVQVTGAEADSASTRLIVATLKGLKEFANFEGAEETDIVLPNVPPELPKREAEPHRGHDQHALGLNLAYTINLNLPATTDQEVFNAIFKSLKEHLLTNG